MESKKIDNEDIPDIIWSNLLNWLTSSDALPKEVKNHFIEHAQDLRLKIQAIVLQMQVKSLHQVAMDVDFEEEVRRDIRNNLPFMSPSEKVEALRAINGTNKDKLDRIKEQVGGLDYAQTITTSIQTLSDIKISSELIDQIKQIEVPRRRQLLATLTSIVDEVSKEDANNRE